MLKSKTKIACVENMNNNMFAVMRFLRHKGFIADLICSNESKHFLPEADTFEETYLAHIKEFDFTKKDILNTNRLGVNRFFSQYDFVIACGASIAYLTFAKVKIDIVIPYGSDLYTLPFYEVTSKHDAILDKWRLTFAKNQKKGIECASAILMDYTSDDFEKVFKKFNLKGARHKYPCPFIFTPEFNTKNKFYLQGLSSFTTEMKAIRSRFDFIAFSHIRQSWKNPEDMWSYKGNDRIFKAFKNFLLVTKSEACLIVFEYGIDDQNSKALVKELGIEANVIWFPLMKRRDILVMISYVDVGIGEVGNYSWFSYGAIYEFLCMKKPVIHRRDDHLYIGKVPTLYPMLSAANEQEVTSALLECYTNKEKVEKIAEDAHNWYMFNAIESPVKRIIAEINNKNWRFYRYEKFFNTFLSGLVTLPFAVKKLIKCILPSSLLGMLRQRINKKSVKQ